MFYGPLVWKFREHFLYFIWWFCFVQLTKSHFSRNVVVAVIVVDISPFPASAAFKSSLKTSEPGVPNRIWKVLGHIWIRLQFQIENSFSASPRRLWHEHDSFHVHCSFIHSLFSPSGSHTLRPLNTNWPYIPFTHQRLHRVSITDHFLFRFQSIQIKIGLIRCSARARERKTLLSDSYTMLADWSMRSRVWTHFFSVLTKRILFTVLCMDSRDCNSTLLSSAISCTTLTWMEMHTGRESQYLFVSLFIHGWRQEPNEDAHSHRLKTLSNTDVCGLWHFVSVYGDGRKSRTSNRLPSATNKILNKTLFSCSVIKNAVQLRQAVQRLHLGGASETLRIFFKHRSPSEI